ncbi:GNAT family N-acetyltransferase [Vibrio cyclitrophicus]|uniref:GNAT family N-acetyltransferase n=1 Tax=Vibrio cyclitrophicus TaxID=47951 RepID=UPI001301B451|nr:GNAT family N-acetyltransferase [Vibrio cyclitrophicus]
MLTNEQVLSFLQDADSDFEPPLSSKLRLETYAEKMISNAVIVDDISNDNLLRGFAATYANDTNNLTAYLTFIGVKSRFRGLGIAKNLIEKTETILLKKGFVRLRLEVYKGNEAIRLYEKIGFVVYKDDSNSYFMEKVLLGEFEG